MSAPSRETRVRYGPLPELTTEVAIPYANTREGALTAAQAVRAMLDSPAFQKVIKPELDAREAARRARKKVAPAYTCEELESVFLYQVAAGIDTIEKTVVELTSHVGAEARRLLGFDRPRKSKSQVTRMHEVPSKATLSRYRLSFAPADAGAVAPASAETLADGKAPTVYDFKRAEAECKEAATVARAELYERFFAELVREYAQTPEAAGAARLLFLDGKALKTLFRCRITENGVPANDEPRQLERCRVKPVLDKPKAQGGREVWDGLLTKEQWDALASQPPDFRRYWKYSADGGYAAGDSESRSGHGYSLINIVDSSGLPIDFVVKPLQEDERAGGVDLLEQIAEKVALLPTDGVRVLIADAGFNGYRVAQKARELGMLESIHASSGSDADRSKQAAARRSARRMYVKYWDRKASRYTLNWYTNGHRELFCDCGQGEVQKRFRHKQGGELVVGLEGQCENCGPISITSGQWRYSGRRWQKVLPPTPAEKRDWSMGNPLTFDNPIAAAYGKRRFAVQEGAHSIWSTRYALGRKEPRRRIKRAEEARLQTLMTFCTVHVLAAEQRKRAWAPRSGRSVRLAA